MVTTIPQIHGITLTNEQASHVLGAHLDQVFDLMGSFKHVNELDPRTRELFRDLRGTLTGFMAGVS